MSIFETKIVQLTHCSQAITHILTAQRVERTAGVGGRPWQAGVCG
jgi:hypothetical protein